MPLGLSALIVVVVPVLAWLFVAAAAVYHLFKGHQRAFSALTIAAAAGLSGEVLSGLQNLLQAYLPLQQHVQLSFVVGGIQHLLSGIGLIGILVALTHRGGVEESDVG